jgi:transposase
MKPIFARRLLPQELEVLKALLHHPKKSVSRRAAIVWLSAEERYRASEISALVEMHASSVRYWIHRFNEQGIAALRPSEAQGWGSRVDSNVRQKLVRLATTPPRDLGLKFTTWTLRALKTYLVEREIVDSISHETIRRVLKDEDVDWRACGTLPERPSIPDLLATFHKRNV